MQPLRAVALPDPVAALLAARHPGFALARCAEATFGLGLVLPLLARSLPFSRAPLGLRVPMTAGEILRGHHLLVLEQRRPVAYAGWAECTREQGQAFLGAQGIQALDPNRREGEAMAFLTWTALSPAAMTVLKTAMRALYPGRPYFARRAHAGPGDGKGNPRVTTRGGVITPLVSRKDPA